MLLRTLTVSIIGAFTIVQANAEGGIGDTAFSNAIQDQVPTAPLPSTTFEKADAAPPSPEELAAQLIEAQNELAGTTLQELENNPVLAEKALNIAIINKNWQAVEELLPIYRRHQNLDPFLADYAQGAIHRERGDYSKAISLYRKLIAEDPNLLRVRMDLAILLFADKQDVAARNQFVKLRSDPNSDDFTKKVIDQYLNEIDKRSQWSFNAGLSYLRDDNINNASSSKTIKLGSLTFVKRPESLPQSGQGVEFYLGAGKDFNVSGSNYLGFDASANGKIYWDNHKYDDVNLKLSAGYKFKNVRSTVWAMPFIKNRTIHSNPYSNSYGVSLYGDYWLTPSWQLSTYNELGWEKNKSIENEPVERQVYASANILWAPKATQFFRVGANIYNVNAEIDENSYTRPGLSAMWNQDWSYGLSSRVNIGYNRKLYKEVGFYGIKRIDNEYSVGLDLWNREWHVVGITPKLAIKFNKTDSNIDDLYSYDKTSVFLKFDKTF